MVFVLLYVFAYLGRQLGKRQLEKDPQNKLGILGIAEGSIFALFGLLVAFTFSGAYYRFEERKMEIIEEANQINTAYMSLQLLTKDQADPIRKEFRNYIIQRINIYRGLNFSNYKQIIHRVIEARQTLDKIWNDSIVALQTRNPIDTEVLLPALSNMSAAANKQFALSRIHPPSAVYILLFGLAFASSFLTGYSTARKKFQDKKPIYIIGYLAATAFTLYIILDLELPRLGVIRITPLDCIIVDMNREALNVK